MSWLVVQQGINPSCDYFIKPFLVHEGVEFHELALLPSAPPVRGLNLVFVRYLTPEWKRWIKRYRDRLGRVVFFMDDDLFDKAMHVELPKDYRKKLYRFATRYQSWLRGIQAELWVSTPWLANKYADWEPLVLAPRSPYADCVRQKTFFYHGSASHMQEIRWLLPVVEEVLQRDAELSFELIGNNETRKLFSHLARVHILQPMSWLAYKALICRPGRMIGLAPLLPNGFNQARSATKFYDITQAGAVGIYADHAVYQSCVRHGESGLLIPMEQGGWAETILNLAEDRTYRYKLLSGARRQVADEDATIG